MYLCWYYSCTKKQKMELFLKKLLSINEQTKRYNLLLVKKNWSTCMIVSSLVSSLNRALFLFTQVAIICNHQRTVSKSHESQMTRLNEKIDELKVGCLLQMSSNLYCFFVLSCKLFVIICFFSPGPEGWVESRLGQSEERKASRQW